MRVTKTSKRVRLFEKAFREGTDVPSPTLALSSLTGSAAAFAAAALAEPEQEGRIPFVLAVTPGLPEADALAGDLKVLENECAIRALEFPPPLVDDPSSTAARLKVAAVLGAWRMRPYPLVVVAPSAALATAVPAAAAVAAATVRLEPGSADCAFARVQEKLMAAGYERAPEVVAVGQYSVRGGVLDAWPPDAARPVRAEYFGDDLESLREFDPALQTSIKKIPFAELPPVNLERGEEGLTRRRGDAEDGDLGEGERGEEGLTRRHGEERDEEEKISDHESTITHFSQDSHASLLCVSAPLRETMVLRGASGATAPLRETHVRCDTQAKVTTLLDVLPEGATILWLDHNSYTAISHSRLPPTPASSQPFTFHQVFTGDPAPMGVPTGTFQSSPLPGFAELGIETARNPELLEAARGRLSAYLFAAKKKGALVVEDEELAGGFEVPGLVVVAKSDRVFAHKGRVPSARAQVAGTGQRLSEALDIEPGELVVHVDYGIGRFMGSTEVEVGDTRTEVFTIE